MPVITIASTKSGARKSTLAVNLSAQFVAQGHDVALPAPNRNLETNPISDYV